MKIYINGQVFKLSHLPSPINITSVLTATLPDSQQQQSFALALNGNFIGREDYCATFIQSNDSIDVLFPIVGG
ncbi:sulfur carrier protein ThiS [Colwellia sp. M166]|uniref:sulfur carrier protein ThiS n=1 Tax=Colwellia sp. M166 TaxID=2583805 RepID=UPI00211E5ED2|nr:sulfur carrier protein ThiS [Colwellia sp. M166]UUO23263.1 sulfur carrier protein ThiS [Colwellia sp. M166]|tara:strand:+ start:5995 stop:6213 length:219 start_codon:yes stop_codon:yes gene_type:complete